MKIIIPIISLTIGICFALAMTSTGFADSTVKNLAADELFTAFKLQEQRIEIGKKIFEAYLEKKATSINPGTPEYMDTLFDYIENQPEGRQKADLVQEYAMEYVCDMTLPKVDRNLRTHQAPNKDQSLDEPKTSVMSGSYNRSGAVAYAYKYVYDYNDKYKPMEADCTNFVSQVMYEGGGIPMVDAWWRPYFDKDDWYYYQNEAGYDDDEWSWSWVKAESLFWHIHDRPLGEIAPYDTDLKLGDIVQFDFDHDGEIDHSSVVTKIDSSGERYVTYHTTDTKDKPLDYFFEQGYDVYGWCIAY